MLTAILCVQDLAAAQREGGGQPLSQKLRRRVTLTWQGQELAEAFARLTRASNVSFWLDRRIDRQAKIDARFSDLSLQQVLTQLTKQQLLGIATLGEVVYIGPQQTSQELAVLAHQARQQLSRAPATIRRRWLLAQATNWPRLSEPKALVTDWLAAANFQLVGGQQIAHDLWPAKSLPPLPLIDRLVLLLAGFDLTCQISTDGKTCEIVPIKRPLKMAPVLPHATTPPNRSRSRSAHQVFTLRLKNQPLGRVLDQLARQLHLEIVWPEDPALLSNTPRKRLVSCDVQEVELNELLRILLASAHLQHQLEGKRVTIQVQP